MGLNATLLLAPLPVDELLHRLDARIGEPEEGRVRLLDLGLDGRSGLVCRMAPEATLPLLRRLDDRVHLVEVSEGAGTARLLCWSDGGLRPVVEGDLETVLGRPEALPEHDVLTAEILAPQVLLPDELDRQLPASPTETARRRQRDQVRRELGRLPHALAAVVAIMTLLLTHSAWSVDGDRGLAALTGVVGVALSALLVALGVRLSRHR